MARSAEAVWWVGQRQRSRNPCAPLTFRRRDGMGNRAERRFKQDDGCIVTVAGSLQIRRVDTLRSPYSWCTVWEAHPAAAEHGSYCVYINLRDLPTYRRLWIVVPKRYGSPRTLHPGSEEAATVASKMPSGFECPVFKDIGDFGYSYRSESECSDTVATPKFHTDGILVAFRRMRTFQVR